MAQALNLLFITGLIVLPLLGVWAWNSEEQAARDYDEAIRDWEQEQAQRDKETHT